jgi:hypothetical protein
MGIDATTRPLGDTVAVAHHPPGEGVAEVVTILNQ